MDKKDMRRADWRKSSYSNGSGACVEVGQADGVRVRDTKDRNGAVLVFDATTWRAFATATREDRNNR
jgi:hypothetical protein